MWEVDDTDSGLSTALLHTAKVVGVLRRHELLEPYGVEATWFVPGSGGIGYTTRYGLMAPLDDPALPENLLAGRPTGFPEAQIAYLGVLGTGTWLDGHGGRRREDRLVGLEVTPDSLDLTFELAVHHDIWEPYDFAGTSHPEVQQTNAPRLAAALQEIDGALGVRSAPGEPTYFGKAEGYGLATPQAMDDGRGPDLTDKL